MSTRNRYIFSSTPGKSMLVYAYFISIYTYIHTFIYVHVMFHAWLITRYYLFYTYFIHFDSILFDCWFTYRAWHILQYVSCIPCIWGSYCDSCTPMPALHFRKCTPCTLLACCWCPHLSFWSGERHIHRHRSQDGHSHNMIRRETPMMWAN